MAQPAPLPVSLASACLAAALLCPALVIAQTSSAAKPDQTPMVQTVSDSAGSTLSDGRTLPPVSARHRSEAEAAYLRGAKRLQAGDYSAAGQEFSHAIMLDPAKSEYTQGLLVAREHQVTLLLQQAAHQRHTDAAAADRLIAQARKLDAENPRVTQRDASRIGTLPASFRPVRQTRAAGTIVLQPNASAHSYHERGDVRTLALKLAGDYGLHAAFDPDLRQQTLRLDVDDVSYADAMRILLLLSGTMATPLDEHTFLLAANTPSNRQRYERVVEETFYLPGYGADQLKDFVSVAQQLLDIRQVAVAPLGGALVVRGPADRVDAVERIFADLLQGTDEVVFDLKLYAVDKSHVRNLGVVLPQSLSAYSLAAQAQSIVSQNSALISQLIASGVLPSTASTLDIAAYLIFVAGIGSSSLLQNSFLLFGGGATAGALAAGNIPTINLVLSESEARTLDDLQLRVSDQQKAIFKSGTRYPIQTSLFSDIASSTASSLAGTTVNGVSLSSLLASYLGTSSLGSTSVIPQVQYEDLGLTVTATPHIQRTGDIGMRLEIKVSALAGTSLNGIPVLDSRQFLSDLTVHDGETVMMISNTSRSEAAAISGLPGLSEVPGFQSTTNRNGSQMSSDMVLLITPHIVRRGHTASTGPYVPLQPRPGDE
ncbi:MAG: type II secretion system protein GspD [Janthinobacterium lividum]